MFDIGFWELVVIGVVALVVIGPERLPDIARKAGMWMGRARRFVQTVKEDIDRELAADELKRALKGDSDSGSMYEIVEETKKAVAEVKGSLNDIKSGVEHSLKDAEQADQAAGQSETQKQENDYLLKAEPKTHQPDPSAPADPKPPISNDDRSGS